MKSLGAALKSLFSRSRIDSEFFEDLEDLLIESDIGAKTSMELIDHIEKEARRAESKEAVVEALKEQLLPLIKEVKLIPEKGRFTVYLVLGVNGVGKTTSIAKMASYYRREHGINDLVLAAGDTFRAGAISQLKTHGERLGFRVVHQDAGSDPGAVIFDSIESAKSRGESFVIADTAGRMHNRANLVKELQKIHKIVSKQAEGADVKNILVIDATTGQNGLRQAEIFHEAVGLDGVVLSKYDSTAKGGIVVPICRELNIPFAFVGNGEKMEDLQPFDKSRFLDELLAIDT